MNSIGMPGAVRPMPVATRARLRPYQERGSDGIAEPRDPLLAAAVDDVVVLRPLHESPVLGEARPATGCAPGRSCSSGRSSGWLALPITSRMAMRRPSVSVVSKPAPFGRRLARRRD